MIETWSYAVKAIKLVWIYSRAKRLRPIAKILKDLGVTKEGRRETITQLQRMGLK